MGADWQRTPCWVPVDADGKRLAAYDGIPHWASEAKALISVTEMGWRDEDGETIADVKALPQPCVELFCDCCGEEYGDDEFGYGVHFANPADAMDAGREYEWTTGPDGTVHCLDCPPLTSLPATVPQVPGQLALDGTEGELNV